MFDTFSKRARYESPVKERWSLARNSISLHDVLDYGVSLLADSESECGSDEERGCENENKTSNKQQVGTQVFCLEYRISDAYFVEDGSPAIYNINGDAQESNAGRMGNANKENRS